MREHVVAIDIGGSKISSLSRRVGSERDVFGDKEQTPADDGVEAVLRVIDRHIQKLAGGWAGLRGLGVAVPGHVDDRGRVLWAGNLEGWVDLPLRSLLEKRYGVPIFIERDANCAALGEKWMGAAKGMNDFVFLALGTGIGAGLFLDGRIYRGTHSAAGEIGNMHLLPPKKKDDPITVSEVVGKKAISKRAERATGEKMSAADALKTASKQRRLRRATRKVVDYLSASVVAVCALLDPEAILFGGGTSEAGEALLGRIRKRVAPLLGTRLMPAALGANSQLYGALWGALEVLHAREGVDRSSISLVKAARTSVLKRRSQARR